MVHEIVIRNDTKMIKPLMDKKYIANNEVFEKRDRVELFIFFFCFVFFLKSVPKNSKKNKK